MTVTKVEKASISEEINTVQSGGVMSRHFEILTIQVGSKVGTGVLYSVACWYTYCLCFCDSTRDETQGEESIMLPITATEVRRLPDQMLTLLYS